MSEIAGKEIVERIQTAKTAIAEAQRDLAGVIGEIEARERAEKQHVGESLNLALGRLRGALAELATLEELLAD